MNKAMTGEFCGCMAGPNDPDPKCSECGGTGKSGRLAQPVAIKPLEWSRETPYHVARVFGNVYVVEAWDGGATLSGISGRRDFATFAEAKAAAQKDFEARIRSALVPPAVPGEVEKPTACVGEMKTSAGSDYYVCVRVGDRELTPHMHKIRSRAEYEVAEWQWLFNGGEKPDILAYREDAAPPEIEEGDKGDGWQLVPIEPTPEMLGAWYRYKNGHHWPDEPPPRDTSDYGAYRAMLAAAPSASIEGETPWRDGLGRVTPKPDHADAVLDDDQHKGSEP